MTEENSNPTQPPEPAGAPENLQESPTSPEPVAQETRNNEPRELEIDLNPLFPGAQKDLNTLFPDQEMKRFLKSLSGNKKDLSALNDRFIQENQSGETPEETA